MLKTFAAMEKAETGRRALGVFYCLLCRKDLNVNSLDDNFGCCGKDCILFSVRKAVSQFSPCPECGSPKMKDAFYDGDKNPDRCQRCGMY